MGDWEEAGPSSSTNSKSADEDNRRFLWMRRVFLMGRGLCTEKEVSLEDEREEEIESSIMLWEG